MAPDLNSMPPSPYTPQRAPSNSLRRPQESMPPPSSLPSTRSPSMTSRDTLSNTQPIDNTGVGVGPGPLRHPRPLTAADLHMQLEKEQEAVVNRLTRELSLLRAQTASVASNASSASAGLPDATDQNNNHLISGPSHPMPSRRHRSSSSLSTRSANTAATVATGTGISGNTVGSTGGVAGSTILGVAPPRDTHSYGRDPLSRQSSVASRRSEASSPSLSSSLYQSDHFPIHTHRRTGSASHGQIPLQPSNGSARSSFIPSTQRYEELAHQRSELDIVKRENEALRRRVRELERTLSSRRQSENVMAGSESVSTNASAVPRGTADEDEDEDSVNVGESAGSVGVGSGG